MKPKVVAVAVVLMIGACSTAEYDVTASDLDLAPPGIDLEEDVTYRYKFYIHCGMEWLHSFNGEAWITDEPIYNGVGRAPDGLRPFFVNPDEVISPELWTQITLVSADEIRLTLPDGSRASTYHPSDEDWPGCA